MNHGHAGRDQVSERDEPIGVLAVVAPWPKAPFPDVGDVLERLEDAAQRLRHVLVDVGDSLDDEGAQHQIPASSSASEASAIWRTATCPVSSTSCRVSRNPPGIG